ncbi:Ankyrin repeat and KH domain-containing protein mask [Gryllus bimaculatus]|nr:Ankyrin repeat and KH domain-containing protein mask [Gryllus bimaculatus]
MQHAVRNRNNYFCGVAGARNSGYGQQPLAAGLNPTLDVDVTLVLLEGGADAGALDTEGRSALCLAADRGHAGCLEALLARGADAERKDLRGWKPLHKAAWHGHLDCVRALLRRGADVHAKAHIILGTNA